MTRIWEVIFRETYESSAIIDRSNVVARTAQEALKKARSPVPQVVATAVCLIASAD